MSKIICEICGTAYPDTASQCPICGCAKPADSQGTTADGGEASAESGYTYVKGGRFSKANVRKRTSAAAVPVRKSEKPAKPEKPEQDEQEGDERGGNRGLLILVLVLLLAIIAVALYIYLTYFVPNRGSVKVPDSTKPAPSITVPDDPTLPTPAQIACTDVQIFVDTVKLDKVGRAYLLEVKASPADTTDTLSFQSSNTKVAAVTAEGRIVAVGEGEAVITVSCGKIQKQCQVVCDFGPPTDPTDPTGPTSSTGPTQPEDPTEPSAPATDPANQPTEPTDGFSLNRTDFSLFSAGAAHTLYSGTVPASEVRFYSDNEAVATFVDGKVTAVGPGTTKVHAEYNGKTLTCIVRCKFTAEPADSPDSPTEPTEEAEPCVIWINGQQPYYGNEATFPLRDSFTITLVNSDGENVDVTWTSSNSEVCTVSGNTATPVSEGYAFLTTTYQGRKYTFKVIVKAEDAVG